MLLSIGDLKGLSVVGWVDEVDVVKVRSDHQVRVSGDAFPGMALSGTVIHVSSQARRSQGANSPPRFKVTAQLQDLTPTLRQQLRLGMSASIDIVVYDKPDALLVPIGAVWQQDEETWLNVRDKGTRKVRKVSVETGVTTLDAVEIVRGIDAGDEVVLSGV